MDIKKRLLIALFVALIAAEVLAVYNAIWGDIKTAGLIGIGYLVVSAVILIFKKPLGLA